MQSKADFISFIRVSRVYRGTKDTLYLREMRHQSIGLGKLDKTKTVGEKQKEKEKKKKTRVVNSISDTWFFKTRIRTGVIVASIRARYKNEDHDRERRERGLCQ